MRGLNPCVPLFARASPSHDAIGATAERAADSSRAVNRQRLARLRADDVDERPVPLARASRVDRDSMMDATSARGDGDAKCGPDTRKRMRVEGLLARAHAAREHARFSARA